MPPIATNVSAPLSRTSGTMYSSLRVLLPPKASPELQSSRLAQTVAPPRCPVSRSSRWTGLGPNVSGYRGKSCSLTWGLLRPEPTVRWEEASHASSPDCSMTGRTEAAIGATAGRWDGGATPGLTEALLGELAIARPAAELVPVRQLELSEHPTDVALDRLDRDVQLARD